MTDFPRPRFPGSATWQKLHPEHAEAAAARARDEAAPAIKTTKHAPAEPLPAKQDEPKAGE